MGTRLLLSLLEMRVECSSVLGLEGVGEKDPSGLVVLWEEEGCSSRFLLDPPAPAADDEFPGEVYGRSWGCSSARPEGEGAASSLFCFFFFFLVFSLSLCLSVSDDGAVAASSSVASSTGSSSFLFDFPFVFDDEGPDPDDEDDDDDPGASS